MVAKKGDQNMGVSTRNSMKTNIEKMSILRPEQKFLKTNELFSFCAEVAEKKAA
jgi:hypothetical protein